MSKVLTVFEIEDEIKKRKQEVADLEAKLELAKLDTPEEQLAKSLHGMLCTWNHTDGCGWFYEFKDKKDDWSGHAHGEYMKKARNLMHICNKEGITADKALEMYKLVRGY
jgi:hypothetical protein